MISTIRKPLFLFCGVMLASDLDASSLEIYTDGANYHYTSDERFVGFNSDVGVQCGTQSIRIEPGIECPSSMRLCTLFDALVTQTKNYNEVKSQFDTLGTLLSAVKPKVVDASAWIDAAMNIGKEKSKLEIDMNLIKEKLDSDTDAFGKQTQSERPYYLAGSCDEEIHLNIPSGMIGASLSYEANLADEKHIVIRQVMQLSNQSGIDIEADEVNIYAKSSYLSLSPLSFNPWTVSVAVPYRTKSRYDAYAEKEELAGDIAPAPMVEPVVEAAPMKVPSVVRTGYRNYAIKSLTLPSNNTEIETVIATEELPMECGLIAYPYKDTNLYNGCSFSPKEAIEANVWKLTKNKRIVSTDARGEYRDGKYLLYTDIDESVLISHKKAIVNDTSSGIFGGSIRKKDGYELTLTNTLATPKEFTLIERIPRSTTDKIKVRLVSVNGAEGYKLNKDGELVIDIRLKANEERKVRVDFELEYDKEISVNY